MKISTRNVLSGKIVALPKGATTAHVKIEIAAAAVVTASITNEAVDGLDLAVSKNASAVIKAPRRHGRGRMKPLRFMLLIAGLSSPAIALAGEPSGCDKFKWPIGHEQQALLTPQTMRVDSGAVLAFDTATSVHLAPLADARLEMPPERAPKAPSFAGAFKLDAPSTGGIFKVTLSDEGWIDVIQDGRFVKAVAFTGAIDCQGVRKSVKFRLETKPVAIQLSNATAADISLMISPE